MYVFLITTEVETAALKLFCVMIPSLVDTSLTRHPETPVE